MFDLYKAMPSQIQASEKQAFIIYPDDPAVMTKYPKKPIL